MRADHAPKALRLRNHLADMKLYVTKHPRSRRSAIGKQSGWLSGEPGCGTQSDVARPNPISIASFLVHLPVPQARPEAFHDHLNPLAEQFPHYPCSSPDHHRLLHLLRHSYATHAAYLRPPIFCWAEAWCFASVLLSWIQTVALLLLPRARRSATWQLLWLGACVGAELLLPSASLLLLRTPPPSFLYHYPPVMLEVLVYSALLGVRPPGVRAFRAGGCRL